MMSTRPIAQFNVMYLGYGPWAVFLWYLTAPLIVFRPVVRLGKWFARADLAEVNWWLLVITTLTTLAYLGFCLWKLASTIRANEI